jgi:hypothetical protein
MKILLYGYYNKHNFGDDLFKFIFEKYLKNKEIEYTVLNPNDLNNSYESEYNFDAILFGGGEIINDYFIFPIFRMLKYNNLLHIPIFGASIGVSKNNIKYVDFFDKCIFRNDIPIINNTNFFYDNDIIFGIDRYYKHNVNISPVINTIGYYLIDDIDDHAFEIQSTCLSNTKKFIRKKCFILLNFFFK